MFKYQHLNVLWTFILLEIEKDCGIVRIRGVSVYGATHSKAGFQLDGIIRTERLLFWSRGEQSEQYDMRKSRRSNFSAYAFGVIRWKAFRCARNIPPSGKPT